MFEHELHKWLENSSSHILAQVADDTASQTVNRLRPDLDPMTAYQVSRVMVDFSARFMELGLPVERLLGFSVIAVRFLNQWAAKYAEGCAEHGGDLPNLLKDPAFREKAIQEEVMDLVSYTFGKEGK